MNARRCACDLPTRLFHWVLMACVIGSVVSAKIGGNAMVWHFRLGYVVFTLLAFRLLWGLVGGRWSRFASFLYAPATLRRYLRGARREDEPRRRPQPERRAVGIRAAGAAVRAGRHGLFADDEIANTAARRGASSAARPAAWRPAGTSTGASG